MTFGIKVTGVNQLIKKLDKIENAMAKVLEKALKQGMTPVERDAKVNAPYQGGALRRSINMQTVKKTHSFCEVNVGTNLIYAKIQEFGGVIKAKKAPKLVFLTKEGWRTATSVTIPAHPYLTPAMDENHDEINAEFKYAMGMAIERSAK